MFMIEPSLNSLMGSSDFTVENINVSFLPRILAWLEILPHRQPCCQIKVPKREADLAYGVIAAESVVVDNNRYNVFVMTLL